jgi:hypothetical protein
MFFVPDTRKPIAIHFEEDQYFFSVVPVQRRAVVISHFS